MASIKRMLLCACLFCLAACQNQTNKEDAFLVMVEDKRGNEIELSDFVSLELTERTEEGEVIRTTQGFDKRPMLMYSTRPYFEGDFQAMLAKLSEGDSAIIKVPIDSLVKHMGISRPASTGGTDLVYAIRVNKVLKRGSLSAEAYGAEIEKLKLSETQTARATEPAKIRRYLQAHQLQPKKTASGLQYILEVEGTGQSARLGDTVVVNYTIATLDGVVLDRNVPQSTGAQDAAIMPYKYKIKANASSGLEEALAFLPNKSKAQLIVPSSLAYGAYGNGFVAPFTPILISVEILDVLTN